MSPAQGREPGNAGSGDSGDSGRSAGSDGRGGAARTRPPQVSHPGPPRSQPGQPPSTIQPGPSGSGGDDSEPWDPGFFYLYDNTSPESIVCQSDPSVQCSSYSGQCSGLPDRLICDGQTVMCPTGAAPDQADQADQPDPMGQATRSGQPCVGRPEGSDQGQGQGQLKEQQAQAKTGLPCRAPGAAAKPAQRCAGRPDGAGRQGQGKAAVSCSGANGVP
jgi:hypothetical protein